MRPNPQEPADLVTFTEEILNGKFHFLFSVKIFLKKIFPAMEECRFERAKK